MNGVVEARIARTELEITIAAPKQRVWRALIDETRLWWRKDFYVGPAESMKLEPKVGGRLFEDWGQDAGVLWYTVVAIDPGTSIDLVGHLTAAFGGPSTSMLRLDLVEKGASTILRLSDSVHGRVDDESPAKLEQGWRLLFGEGLKPFVEG